MTVNLQGKLWCYHITGDTLADDGQHIPSLVIAGESGHYPMMGNGPHAVPWKYGTDYDAAVQAVDDLNLRRGVDKELKTLIVAASMTPHGKAIDMAMTRARMLGVMPHQD